MVINDNSISHTIIGASNYESGEAVIQLNPLKNQYQKHSITGKFSNNSDRFHGQFLRERIQFVLAKQKLETEDISLLGVFVGAAFPDSSLKDFMLPTNPISWVVLGYQDRLMISGLFEDSGDVAGRSSGFLSYALTGAISPQTKEFSLTKVYEECEETRDVTVEYTGRMIEYDMHGYKSIRLIGQWRNSSGAFGDFLSQLQCYAQEKQNATCAVVYCEGCRRWLAPPEMFWHHEESRMQSPAQGLLKHKYFRCQNCFEDFLSNCDSSQPQIDMLLHHNPQIIHFPRIVSHEKHDPNSLSRFIKDCLVAFKDYPLITHVDNMVLKHITYGEIAKLINATGNYLKRKEVFTTARPKVM
jgi:hypothetical protein